MNKISVRQSEDRFYWRVAFECCDRAYLDRMEGNR